MLPSRSLAGVGIVPNKILDQYHSYQTNEWITISYDRETIRVKPDHEFDDSKR